MEYIHEIHKKAKSANRPVISIEFFPPKTEKGDESLLNKTIPKLMELKPDYCSVTIQEKHGLTAMSHLTCVNATEAELKAYLDESKKAGIKNILALRGDPPAGSSEFQATEGGFEYSYQLVELIRSYDSFSIGVAGFPEGHIACKEGKQADWKHLKSKADAGADFVLTQLFFDNQDYFEFCDFVKNQGDVQIPICPGILP
jgi:methylenetetrahydrofolate reductase (NADPH)